MGLDSCTPIAVSIIETHIIEGRGLILTASRKANPLVDFNRLHGKSIVVNAKSYRVRGVEGFIKPMDPPIMGDTVGLRVTPL